MQLPKERKFLLVYQIWGQLIEDCENDVSLQCNVNLLSSNAACKLWIMDKTVCVI